MSAPLHYVGIDHDADETTERTARVANMRLRADHTEQVERARSQRDGTVFVPSRTLLRLRAHIRRECRPLAAHHGHQPGDLLRGPRARGAGRPRASAARRSSERSGDSGDSSPAEPEPAPRLTYGLGRCDCGHLAENHAGTTGTCLVDVGHGSSVCPCTRFEGPR